jgi:cytochrome c biogenesis protein CcmG/thiol:disulfide interchange protein DsbE
VDIAKSSRVSLFGLNYKDDRQDAMQWLTRYQDPYRFSIFDPLGKLGIELGVTAAPETFVIDNNGIIRMKFVGPIDDKVWQQHFLPMILTIEKEIEVAGV